MDVVGEVMSRWVLCSSGGGGGRGGGADDDEVQRQVKLDDV